MQYTVYTHIYVQLVHRLRSTLEDSLYVDLFPWQAETCCVTWGQAGAEGNAAKEQAEMHFSNNWSAFRYVDVCCIVWILYRISIISMN